jgi:hypothetical protein
MKNQYVNVLDTVVVQDYLYLGTIKHTHAISKTDPLSLINLAQQDP